VPIRNYAELAQLEALMETSPWQPLRGTLWDTYYPDRLA
jgi:hypothetical protein